VTAFDLLAPLSKPRRVCSAPAGNGWLSTRDARRDLARLLSALDQQGAHGQPPAPNPETTLLVVASDRYHMLLACLAAWLRGSTVSLPPNHQPGTLDDVRTESGAQLVLTDAMVARSLASEHGLADEPRELADRAPIPADRPVLTVFTSGTTGDHQACTKTAGQLFGEALTLAQALAFDPSRSVAATVPCHHLYGLLFSVLVPYFSGAGFVRDAAFQPAEICGTCQHWQVTDLVAVPAHLAALVEAGWAAPFQLERAFSSGAVLDVELACEFRRISGAQVVDVLGSTESGGIAWRVSEPGAVYVPLPGVEVAATEDSRLLLRSPFLPPGTGWEAMSDRIRLVAGGFEHLGRSDGIVKLGGKRVAVQELEARARQLDGITDAAVLVMPSTELRKTELWLAVAAEHGDWTRASLREALGRYFDPVLLPRRYRVVHRLPRNALGKLEKAELERLFAHDERAVRRAAGPKQGPDARPASDSSETCWTTDVWVPEQSPFFQGHFPGRPVLPGVAQLSEFVLPAILQAWAELHQLERIPVLKYKRPIQPGARLALELRRRGAASVHFELREDGELCSAGQLCFVVSGARESTMTPPDNRP